MMPPSAESGHRKYAIHRSEGAAGVLTGLVFVGVSINLEKIMSQPAFGLAGRAAEALILLVAVLTVSVLLFVPRQGTMIVGVEVLAIGIAAWGWIVAIQLLRLKGWQAMKPDLRQAFVLRVALGQVATAERLANVLFTQVLRRDILRSSPVLRRLSGLGSNLLSHERLQPCKRNIEGT